MKKKILEESAQTQCEKHLELSENKANHNMAKAVLGTILQHKISHIPENSKVKTSQQEKNHNSKD